VLSLAAVDHMAQPGFGKTKIWVGVTANLIDGKKEDALPILILLYQRHSPNEVVIGKSSDRYAC
jgi:hypothetical protein